MRKDLNEGKFEKKNLMVDKFSKMTYINDQKKFLKNDLYIEPKRVNYKNFLNVFEIFFHKN